MTMTRWNPWLAPAWRRNSGNLRIDVEDKPDHYSLTASLPGFEADDVDISITGRVVTVSAESKSESEDTAEGAYVLRERYSGSLIRRLILPGSVDAANATSEFTNGVLRIRLPKASGSETHKVAVGAGS